MSDDAKPPGQIYGLMSKVMADVKAVGKTRDNQQQGYKFRGIDEVYEAVNPALVKHGVFVIPTVQSRLREERQTHKGGTLLYTVLEVLHTFYAPDGSCVGCVTVGEAMDSGDKSANKAMSAAMKYALIETFCIPVHEPIDTENESPQVRAQAQQKPKQPATPQQVAEMKSLLGNVADDWIKKCFDAAKVECWDDMPGDKLAKCIQYAKSRKQKVAA